LKDKVHIDIPSSGQGLPEKWASFPKIQEIFETQMPGNGQSGNVSEESKTDEPAGIGINTEYEDEREHQLASNY
jgi:hypothetical protein